MLKRWADLPRSGRWLIGIAVIVLALAIVWALFVPVADWLAHHDIGSAKGAPLQPARDAARGRLLTLGAGLLAAGALVFTARNFILSREGQVTDRYTKAIEQLGSDKGLDVRIGGIYALERVARDSAKDHPAVMEVLTAFIREHSREQWRPQDSGGREQEPRTRPDVHAAVTVVGRRDAKRDIEPINLNGAYLFHADLTGADLTDARLRDAKLVRAYLAGAKLSGARLGHADLSGADLTNADLTGARLRDAKLVRANLTQADLTGADLTDADLEVANLSGANLSGAKVIGADLARAILLCADLTGADLIAADLTSADLTSTNLTDTKLTIEDLTRAVLAAPDIPIADLTAAHLTNADLTGANLIHARWSEDARVPKGWERDLNHGLLVRTDTDSGPPEAT
jgi:uncharacterized protein YjbI with pentapeptide repeats